MKGLTLMFLPLLTAGASACCGVGGGAVRFTGQRDIVIWDAERKIEHFVREASFESGTDLGFLAPVPSVPTFAEASVEAFTMLETLTAPKSIGCSGPEATAANSAGGIDILKRENVAGYDAAVLKARDAKALRDWLSKHKFPAPAWMENWAAPYLAKGWPIVAFRILKNEGQRPVRMSFATERPFAPYAVPKENGDEGAMLKLYLVSVGDMKGVVGDRNWRATHVGSGSLSEETRVDLAKGLKFPVDAIPEGASVDAYQDVLFGTESTYDLTFEPDRRMGIAAPGIVGGAGVLIALAARRRIRRRRRME